MGQTRADRRTRSLSIVSPLYLQAATANAVALQAEKSEEKKEEKRQRYKSALIPSQGAAVKALA